MIAVKSRVDTWLGRFTMYRLILWVLAVLVVFSMFLFLVAFLLLSTAGGVFAASLGRRKPR